MTSTNRGSIPDLSKPEGDSDFYFVQADDPEAAVPRIIELVKTRIPQRFGLDPVRDIQVLCPMNRVGVGARSLNIELQAALNPAGERKVERFGWTFAAGDKVMQIAGAGLRCDDPQEPGLGIPGRRDPRADPALRHAAAELALYRSDPRETLGRAGRPEEGRRHRRAQRVRATTVVETERMVGRICDTSQATVGDGLIMAVSDLDILRAAHLHLERHGDQASRRHAK